MSPPSNAPEADLTTPPAVSTSGLGKTFGVTGRLGRLIQRSARRHPIDALTDITFSVSGGEVVALTGGNGAGKSTLLRILATLVSPTHGQAWVGGLDVEAEGPRVRSRLSLATADERAFSLRLTGRENLEFFAALHGVGADRVPGALERSGLAKAGDDAFATYSTGMRQRLGLARALLTEAPLLLLDEPFRALDADGSRALSDLVAGLAQEGTTVIAATHHLDEMRGLWTSELTLDAGRLIYQGAPR